MRRGRAALAVTVATGALLAVSVPAQAAAAPPVTAAGAFLLDSATGTELFSKEADTKRQMASTTKIMTMIVVTTSPGIDLTRTVPIRQEYLDYVVREGASSAHLVAGATPTVRQLLYGLMLPSGGDAAYALADTFGSGTTTGARTADFIAKMNAKAKALGMTNTVYDSFDGISPTGNNLTTPRDLAKLTKYAMTGVTFQAVVKATSYSTGGTSTDAAWKNSNLLLQPRPTGYEYPGAIGVKTGTGTAAGKCLVFAVNRNGKTVIGVLLNDEERYADSMALSDWALGSAAGSKAAVQRSNTDPIPDILD
ncbi:D-alanyl-D-alanine carboxypeptidase family protein [Streptomyces sp. ISL-94]|uniref:D-alanyl-D-alanine carboxypeptidase family protein n=1 Tax=Streptomyces sp. ISL-94 TaxID=2819190 RepID=UPI001BE9CBAE|nr:serine hydrolase [Streptomyces sp. ISL-94]MBT2477246.1 D-alanyl-D-alanine carboxypeptidase [Streptomyces sp. ISL-94]